MAIETGGHGACDRIVAEAIARVSRLTKPSLTT